MTKVSKTQREYLKCLAAGKALVEPRTQSMAAMERNGWIEYREGHYRLTEAGRAAID